MSFSKSQRGLLPLLCLLLSIRADAESFLKASPRYERYKQAREARGQAVKSGALNVTWDKTGEFLSYERDGKRYKYHVEERQARELGEKFAEAEPNEPPGNKFPRPQWPGRGRQFTEAISPDGQHKAFYRDCNLWLVGLEDTNEVAVTTEGNQAKRVKCGNGTWTYGEELDQSTAIWWSSNNQHVAFYRFDESAIPDYHVVLDHGKLHTQLLKEPYPKAGTTNPVVDLLIYDRLERRTVHVDVRSGKPFTDDVLGHYVYGVRWSWDGRELLFFRTDRRQKAMELCAANPQEGSCRVIVREEWQPSWVENSPTLRFLKDGRRFIWSSERTGWKNFYLYDLSGALLGQLTDHLFEVDNVVLVDETRGEFFYTARSGENYLKLQLHRVCLDGSGEQRLTDPAFTHRVRVSPTGGHFVDVAETHCIPPTTTLRDREGRTVTELAISDLTRFREQRLREVEMFTFPAGDGETPLLGLLHFPSDFKPKKKYPLLVSVYAGPATSGAHETFTVPSAMTELGFLVASFDSRTASGRGKRRLDSCYQDFGGREIDDQAAGVRFLGQRRYVDRDRVGTFGTSYGGTASAMCLLRYPELFRAASSSAPVTDFRLYDTTYTERYLGLPGDGPQVYDAASVVARAEDLQGHLLLYIGTADDNVHPANGLRLAEALDRAGKRYTLAVGMDVGHASIDTERMLDFFLEHLPEAR